MLNIVICEDNTILLNQYKLIVDNYIRTNNVTNARLFLATPSPTIVEQFIEERDTNPALFFLDIEFASSKERGIDIATKIRDSQLNAHIVFITTHEELAPLTFERQVEPLDYIVKENGIDYVNKKIYKSIDTTLKRIEASQETQVFFKYTLTGRIFREKLCKIDFFETSTQSHKITMHTANGIQEFRDNLTNIGSNYAQFYRVQKDLLINQNNVSSIDTTNSVAIFEDGTVCNVAKNQIARLKRQIFK